MRCRRSKCGFFLFLSSTFHCLDLSSFPAIFLSTPAKQPGRPGSLCLGKNILSSSIFNLSRASACEISNKLSKSIWNFSDRRLWISCDFVLYYWSTSFFTQFGEDFVGILSFFQKIMRSRITRFALSLTVNWTSRILKNKTARICLFDGSFAYIFKIYLKIYFDFAFVLNSLFIRRHQFQLTTSSALIAEYIYIYINIPNFANVTMYCYIHFTTYFTYYMYSCMSVI